MPSVKDVAKVAKARLGIKSRPRIAQTSPQNGVTFNYREGTTDLRVIDEVWSNHPYTPAGFEINRKDIVLDIGAHVGSFTVMAAKLASEGKVVAYEPNPSVYQILKMNVEANALTNVSTYSKAISRNNGKAKLYLNAIDAGSSHIHHRSHIDWVKPTIEVETITLEEAFKADNIQRVDFLKMDCEGAEWDILESSKNILDKIGKMSLEFHEERGHNTQQLTKLLQDAEFEVKVNRKRTEDNFGYLYAQNMKNL